MAAAFFLTMAAIAALGPLSLAGLLYWPEIHDWFKRVTETGGA